MKKLFTLFIIFNYSIFSSQAQTGLSVPQLAAFDAAMTNLMNTYNVPGGQLAIAYHGKLVYNRGFGYADTTTQSLVQPNSQFRIASISKPVTAVAIMKLFEQGLINLDAKAFGSTGILNDTTYQTILDSRVNDITVRQLLQHSGGWDRYISGDPMFNSFAIATFMGATPPADPVTVIRYMLAHKMLDFNPGTQYKYSNFGYCVLGRIIEKITGQPYHDYVTTNILNAAGITGMQLGYNMLPNQLPNEVHYYDYAGAPLANSVYNNTTQVPWPYGGFNVEAMDAHGGWIASAEDLCKLLVAIDKFPTKPDILNAATIDTMIQPSVNEPTYACGIAVNSNNNWWHSGSLPGTSTEFVRAGNLQINWALLFNTRNATIGPLETAIDNLVWNNLSSVSSWPTHDLFTSIEETSTHFAFNLYPNPAIQSFVISLPAIINSNDCQLKVFDGLGKERISTAITGGNSTIDVGRLPSGIYFVKLQAGNTIAAKKLIIHH